MIFRDECRQTGLAGPAWLTETGFPAGADVRPVPLDNVSSEKFARHPAGEEASGGSGALGARFSLLIKRLVERHINATAQRSAKPIR